VTFRSRGGSDEDVNLTTLCAAHAFELPLGRFAAGDRVLTSS
jgi:hypothetical protein